LVLAHGRVGDRPGGGCSRHVIDQDGTRFGDGLHACGGVDHVAGHHALADRCEPDGCLTGHDPGSGLKRGPVAAVGKQRDGIHHVERSPDRTLGVVLSGDRGAPDGHHGVPDELLDRAAVPRGDGPRPIEVGRLQLADHLGVAVLRQAGEPHEVHEQHGHLSPLRIGPRSSGYAVAAGAGLPAGAWTGGSVTAAPHDPQNRSSGATAAAQLGHTAVNGVPQPPQNRCVSGLPRPHDRHSTGSQPPAVVIVTMAVLATGLNRTVATGAALFVVSDALIALDAVAGLVRLPAHDFWVMLTYLAAQLLIAVGVASAIRAPATA
jgi:hypothetical protein